MKIYRSVLCIFLALVMILSFSACNTAPTGSAGEETAVPSEEAPEASSIAISIPPNPYEGRPDLVVLNREAYVNRPRGIKAGTVLNYAAPNDVPSLLPWNCLAESWLTGNIYEGLLYMYMNDPMDIRGCIAESWTHSDDYLTWSFQICDGIMFTDETACDAPAIVKSWDVYYEASPATFNNLNMVSWEAASDKALVITLSAPCAWLETSLSRLFIVSPTALELYGADDNRAAVGTGPYYVDSYTESVRIVLKANPEYSLEEKLPCIETVNFLIIRDQYDVISALTDGSVDGASFDDVETYRSLLGKSYSGTLITALGNINPVWLDAKLVEVFQTREVREAMCRFIDFDAVNESLYDCLGWVQDSLWAKGTSAYVPTDQFYYDPDEGQSLLASVGLAASGIQFTVHFIDTREDLYEEIRRNLTESGVDMTIEQYMPESSFTYLYFDNGLCPYGSLGYSNYGPYIPWTFILEPDAFIKTCWQDIYAAALYEKMLSEYNAMMSEPTWDGMLAHCRQLTTYVQDDFGAIGGVQVPAFAALSSAFKDGVYFSVAGYSGLCLQLYYLYQ